MAPGLKVRVVGGGIIGMSVAWRLTQGGAAVSVFDAGSIGEGASWAAAGMLAPGGEVEGRTQWTGVALRSLEIYPEFVEQLRDASHVPIDFRKCGAFDVAFHEEEAEHLRRRAAVQGEAGIYSEQFPASRVPGIRRDACAAQYYPDDAVVNPRDLLHALRVALGREGARIHEMEAIARVRESDPYDATVIAAGAWSSGIDLGEALPEVRPVRGHLIGFEERTGLCDAIIRHGATYLVRRGENLAIAGSSMEEAGFERELDGCIAADIAFRAGEIVPALRGRSYFAWNGLRPAAEEPVVRRLGETNIWLAYGHFRNGILLAPATAERIATEVMQASSQKDSLWPAAPRR